MILGKLLPLSSVSGSVNLVVESSRQDHIVELVVIRVVFHKVVLPPNCTTRAMRVVFFEPRMPAVDLVKIIQPAFSIVVVVVNKERVVANSVAVKIRARIVVATSVIGSVIVAEVIASIVKRYE